MLTPGKTLKIMTSTIRSYKEVLKLDTFDERFQYLCLTGSVGVSTFGFDRHINQKFYRSNEWRQIREWVIVRDEGCDLAIPGYEIHHEILIHHINPMNPSDILEFEEWILNPDYLITTTKQTHNALHFGGEPRKYEVITRKPGDTKLW